MLLHELIQVILVLIDALQEVRPLQLQPVQLLVHLAGGRTRASQGEAEGWLGGGLVNGKWGLTCRCVR